MKNEKIIKTCQITCVHDRYDSRIFHKIAKSLSINGFESYLLCVDNLSDEIVDGVIIKSINKTAQNKVQRVLFSWKRLKKPALSINADIYQLHDPELLPLAKFLKKKGKKVIFDSHEDYQKIANKDWIPSFLRPFIKFFYIRYEKRILKRLDGCISVTPHIVLRIKKINSNTEMITNYPRLVPYYKHSFENKIICFGGSEKEYAHKETIAAINELNGLVKYRFLCDLSQKTLAEYSDLPGWKFVEHSSTVSFEELRKVYKNSSIGLAINYYTINSDFKNGSLGVLKLFEYMAEGMPIICTDFVLWKQIIEKYNCGICVNPYSKNSIKDAILSLINNPDKMKIMGENSRKAAECEFNWEKEELKLISFYSRIIEHII